MIFHNATVILPDRLLEDGAVAVRDGKIVAVGARRDLAVDGQVIDAQGGYLAPGFLDIHVHGGAGADYMDGTAEAVVTANRCHARHGTTTIFPTTTTGTPAQIERMLRACRQVKDKWSAGDGARVGGVHLYGPYFAENKIGAHPPGRSRAPDPGEYLKNFDLDIIRVATCAAELPGSENFYREAARRGCLVTCGHSDATWGEMARAFASGMRHVDHFWCAMSSVASLRDRFKIAERPMQAGMEQFVLFHEEMSTEVIADGSHLSPELLYFAYRMKGPKRLCLVTDSSRAVDMPPGEYKIGSQEDGNLFTSNGKVGFIQPGWKLASGVLGMDVMIRNMLAAGASLPDTIRMASLTPAERVGMAADIGSLEVGKRADLVVLDRDLGVRRVFLDGQEFSK